jgi:hypothetical protein
MAIVILIIPHFLKWCEQPPHRLRQRVSAFN